MALAAGHEELRNEELRAGVEEISREAVLQSVSAELLPTGCQRWDHCFGMGLQLLTVLSV